MGTGKLMLLTPDRRKTKVLEHKRSFGQFRVRSFALQAANVDLTPAPSSVALGVIHEALPGVAQN